MIIADENIDARIIRILRDNKYEIYSVAEELQGISDIEIIKIAKETDFIILTEDKDFGEWVFSHKEKNISVIFLRYPHLKYNEIANTLVKLLSSEIEKLRYHFTTVTVKKIRSRKI